MPRCRQPIRDPRMLALITIGGVALATILTVVAHLEPDPGMDPWSLTISDYAVSNRGGPMDIAMFVLGAASLALPLGLRAARVRAGVLPMFLLVVWGVGLSASAIVPTDPIGVPMTMDGYIHRYVSVTAFVCLPIAALLLARRLASDSRWQANLQSVRMLALASVLGLAGLYYSAFPGERVLMGLVERVLVAVEVALLAVIAVRLYRAAGPVEPSA
ncbi:DUF998 domain-containing protein [Micromonospora polyrhachis]|nr:DUF998 domain-containing protein [Micromonospora polyrhachis]